MKEMQVKCEEGLASSLRWPSAGAAAPFAAELCSPAEPADASGTIRQESECWLPLVLPEAQLRTAPDTSTGGFLCLKYTQACECSLRPGGIAGAEF